MVYDANTALGGRYAVDRFAIDVDLGAVPANRSRQMYYGIYNISEFDLSFKIGCSENFSGRSCNISSPDCGTSCTAGSTPGSTQGTSPTVVVAPVTSGGPSADNTSVTTFGYNSKDVGFLK